MCLQCDQTLAAFPASASGAEPTKAEAFANRMAGVLNDAALALMLSVGHRTRLFDVLATLPPATSAEIAQAASLSERYVREWLGAMVTGAVVEFDPATKRYRLPPEHAESLTRASKANAGVAAQFIPVLAGVEDEILQAFVDGQGVPYSSYRDFHRVMAEESGQSVVAALGEHILPLAAGLHERLTAGIDVVDVGCGAGRAMLALAQAYPQSRFAGYDMSAEAIGMAIEEALRLGLKNVRFEVRDAADLEPAAYDLVTAFDAIHDQAAPANVLAAIHQALRPGGLFLMQDIKASSHVDQNLDHPLGTFVYTVSCLHCMSVSLASGGAGLGAAWGRELAVEMLADAGFGNVQVQELPHDPMNYYYLAPKAG